MRTAKRLGGGFGLMGLAIAGGTLLLGQSAPSTQPASSPATGPATNHNGNGNGNAPFTRPTKIAMYFKDAEVNAVLEHLTTAAGYKIVLDQPVTGRVNILASQPVPISDVIPLLNEALQPLGVVAIEKGQQTLRIVSRDKGKKMNLTVVYETDAEKVPDNENVYTYVIPIKNVDVTRLRQDLATMLPLDADIAANGGSNTLIITDTGSSIKRVMRIVAAIDSHDPEETSYKIFELKFANAAATAKLIQSIFPQTNQQQQQGNQRGNFQGPGGFQFTPGGGGGPGGFGGTGFGGNGGGGGGGGGRRGGGGGGGAGGGSVDRARGSKMNVASDDRTNRLIVTAPADTIKLIEAIVKDIDQDQTIGLELHLFKLENSDATSAAKMINSVFSSQTLNSNATSGSSNNGGFQGFFPGGGGGGGRGSRGSSGDTGTSAGNSGLDVAAGRVNAVADDRTNSVVVTAPSKAMDMIKGMINSLESDKGSTESFFIYPLRNAQAANLEYVLNTLFGNGGGGSSASRGSSSSRTGGTSGRTNSNSFGGGGSSGFGGSSGGFGGGSTSFGSGSGTGRSRGSTSYGSVGSSGFGSSFGGNRGSSSSNNSVSSDFAGQVFVVADTDTNSLLVTVATRFAEPVKRIIANLDRPVPQVLIKVLVCEVTHDNSADLGLDWSIINRRPSGQGTSISSNFGNSQITTGLVISTLEDKLNAQLHLLANTGKLDVLSRPYILASDNQPASITVGNSVPFITNTRITDTGQQINTIQYQDVGIILNVTPHINPDGLVIMDVTPEVSQLSGTTVPIGNGVSAPVIQTRSADSRVGVRNGQTIVIGGLMEDRKTSTVEKIPLLGDVPLVGWVFTRTQVTKSKTELLFFITPHVAQQPDSLQAMTEEERRGLTITPNAVGPGKFQEHMQGMERGQMPTTKPANDREPSEVIPIPPRPTNSRNQYDPNAPSQPFNQQPPGGGFNEAPPPEGSNDGFAPPANGQYNYNGRRSNVGGGYNDNNAGPPND